MKNLIGLMILVLGTTQFSHAQEQDTLKNIPDERITVEKEYDDKGNLIRYDSTYVFEWRGDTLIGLPKGQGFFHPPGFMGMEDIFKDFFSDSTLMSPFGHDWDTDPFMHRHDFFKRFQKQFNDSTFRDHFSFKMDSSFFQFHQDSTLMQPFPFHFKGFSQPDQFDLFKDFDFHGEFNNDQFFKDKDQQEEWEEIMKKHQEEIKKFKKVGNQKIKRSLILILNFRSCNNSGNYWCHDSKSSHQ